MRGGSEASDPFRHHPELRGQITPAEASTLRAMSPEKIREMIAAHGGPADWLHTDAEREQNRAETLTAHSGGDLWVFGYGSLMWDPAVRFAEVRRACVTGYARRFILRDVLGGRGTPDRPGVMAALDEGDHCNGLAFRIAAADIEAETEVLWRREKVAPAYRPNFVTADFGDGTVSALTFLADPTTEMVDPDLPRHLQIEYLATGTGFLGTSADYIRGVVRKCHQLGIEDAETEALLADVEARIGAQA